MKNAVILGLLVFAMGSAYGQDVDTPDSEKLEFKLEQGVFAPPNKIGQKRKLVQKNVPAVSNELKQFLTHALGAGVELEESRIFSNPSILARQIENNSKLSVLGIDPQQLQDLLNQQLRTETTEKGTSANSLF